LIYNLRNIVSIENIGGKAKLLGKLISLGIRVPEGIVLSFDFFNDYMIYNNIIIDRNNCINNNLRIQNMIIDGEMPEHLTNQLVEKLYDFNLLNDNCLFAVRSSAHCEDSKHRSMAGIFESFIEVENLNNIINAIKKCYVSLFKDHVIQMLLDNEITIDELNMGVIIQKYIAGDVSGVAFTADPINGDTNVINISYTLGKCSNFVSGLSQSSTYIINKKNKDIKCKTDNALPIDAKYIQEIFMQSQIIENLLSDYCDIEWTISSNSLYVLQARPITSFLKLENNVKDDGYYWILRDLKAYKPLLMDLLKIRETYENKFILHTCYATDFYRILKFVDGYCYLRIEKINDNDIQTNQNKYLRQTYKKYNKNELYYDAFINEIYDYIDKFSKYKNINNACEDLLDYFLLAIDYISTVSYRHFEVTTDYLYLNDFAMSLKKYGYSTEELYDLVFSESEISKERQFLMKLAHMVKTNESLLKLFLDCKFNDLLWMRLQNKFYAKLFLEEFYKYLKKYEYYPYDDCDVGELSSLITSKPSKVIEKIRNLLNVNHEEYFENIISIKKNQKTLYNKIIKNVEDKNEFKNKYYTAKRAFLVNDNHHFFMERLSLGYFIHSIEHISNYFFEQKYIDEKKDIQFLYIDEIKSGLNKKEKFQKRIYNRKITYQKQIKITPFNFLGDNCFKSNDENNTNTIVLKGISGKKICVKGKVKIGSLNYINDSLNEKNILVYRSINGVDNLLSSLHNILGFICEIGSPFDHVGIIAREMNIPAIYNVKDATKILKDGDFVEIDGINEKVIIYKE